MSRTWKCFVVLISVLMGADGARAEQELDTARYHHAVEYCRGDVDRPVMLSADRKILCFDGPIIYPFDASQLEEGGLFVVRSLEGVGVSALTVSEALLRRRATVIIYDYCLSACATYFFFASERTYVLKGALVAWQAGGGAYLDCPVWLRPFPDDQGSLTRAPCDALPGEPGDSNDRYVQARRQFYSRRSNAAYSIYPPTTPNIARFIRNMRAETGVWPNVAWTLNPTYLYEFKTKIRYEAYPANQHEVDEMAAQLQVPMLRLGVRKVIYDP